MAEAVWRERVWVWGVPFAPITQAEAVDAVSALIRAGRPSFFITAPTHYAMLTEALPDLRADQRSGGLHRGRRRAARLGIAAAGALRSRSAWRART